MCTVYTHSMVEAIPLRDKSQTGNAIADLIRRYSGDLQEFEINGKTLDRMGIDEYFALVRDLPYQLDTPPVEIVARPIHILTQPWGIDCKKRAVLIGSWLQENGLPWRIVAVSRYHDGQIHHCIVQARVNGDWRTLDAMPGRQLWDDHPWTRAETISGDSLGTSPELVILTGDGSYLDVLRARREWGDGIIMGEPISAAAIAIVSAVVTAVGAVTAGIVSAVSSKRRQERELSYAASVAREQTDAQQTQAADTAKLRATLTRWGLPLAVAAGIWAIG